ncbi:homeobox protein Hox-A6 isoform X2 [Zonotrichia leucophrys gambelii]|uniref:homeobox protein Hox-A6 isoform X2 n=1 Tax=Zonotrichia leucophrys gambelii TaxID=257770 RepID=UPI003140B3DF
MAISSSPAGRCGILDSKHWRGRFSTCNLANFLLLLAPKGGRFVSCAAKATAVKVAGAPVSQNLKGYVCLLAIQIVRFRDRSIQTTSSQYYVKNGSLQVKGSPETKPLGRGGGRSRERLCPTLRSWRRSARRGHWRKSAT